MTSTGARNGAKWRRRDGWMSTESYCEWYGVTCLEKDFGVAFVDLRDNGMEGRHAASDR